MLIANIARLRAVVARALLIPDEDELGQLSVPAPRLVTPHSAAPSSVQINNLLDNLFLSPVIKVAAAAESI